MPTKVAATPMVGVTKQEVTETRYIPDTDPSKSPFAGMDLFEVMASTTSADWESRNWLLYIYRDRPKVEGFVLKIARPISEDELRYKEPVIIDGVEVCQGIGGGSFHYYLKQGSQRIKEGNFDFLGTPRLYSGGEMFGGSTGGGSDVVRIVDMMLARLKQEGVSPANLQNTAMINALEIQKAAIISNNSDRISTKDLIELLDRKRGGDEPPEWLKQVMTAAIPMFVGLVGKMLEPKDTMQMITTFGQAMNAFKGISGTADKPDMAVELIRNAPGLLGEGSKFLAEIRATDQVKQQNLLLEQNRVMPANPPNATSARPAAPATAARPVPPPAPPAVQSARQPQSGVNAEIKDGRPSPEYVWDRVASMCEKGESGGWALEFLEEIDPDFVKQMREAQPPITADQIKQAVENGLISPVIQRIAKHPNFDKFVRELHAALMEPVSSSSKPN